MEYDADRAVRQALQLPAAGAPHSTPDRSGAGIDAPGIVRDVLRQAGKPLDAGVRRFFEQRLKHDFGSTRIHSDPQAGASARSISAAAYTAGNHIAFADNAYRPGTPDGRYLLAHELAHVVQNNGRAVTPIRRFGTGEHVKFGEIHGKQQETTVNGVRVTYGELIALGDFFDSPDQLYAEPKDKLEALLAAVRRDAASPGSIDTAGWEKLTGGRYLTLARNNAKHFSPTNPAILPTNYYRPPSASRYSIPAPAVSSAKMPNNKAEYERLHAEALALAHTGDMNKAVAVNGFADHFLTDAFAAGHMVNKFDVTAAFKRSMDSGRGAFLTALASKIWDSMEVRSAFSPYTFSTTAAVLMGAKGVYAVATLVRLLSGIDWIMGDLIPNAAVKSVHDKLNAQGVMVHNAAKTWRTVGDSSLSSSPDTLEMGRLAVEASQGELRAAATGKIASPPFDEVWKFVPTPTTSGSDPGLRTLARETAGYTDASNSTTITAIAELTKSSIDTLIEKLVSTGVMERTEAGWAPSKPEDYAYPAQGGF